MEATFLKTKVKHFSFVTGLLHGGPIEVNVILGMTIEKNPDHYTMIGDLFQCNDLISFTEGETIPEEFETEIWESDCDDNHKWQLKRKAKYSGVKWLSKEHTNPEDSMCSAKIIFTCDNIQEEIVENGRIAYVGEKTSHRITLRRVLQKLLDGPKHSPSYLGA